MHQNQKIAPFNCGYSPQIPELLLQLGCSIGISTYQAGKLIFISPKDENSLVQLPRTFDKPMGIAIDETNDKLALACKDTITVFANSKELAFHYPKAPKKYDSLYLPRVSYHTNNLDVHDLNFGKNGRLYGVNTLFSCLIRLDDNYNFTPYWKPNFVDKLVSEDRCHLNGMAMKDGLPKYVTSFNQGNTKQSWRDTITTTGSLIDVEEDRVICSDLAMPHSPRIFNGELYVLLSATGELIRVNPSTGTKEVIYKTEGFVRGMDLYKDYLFIGLSKLRKNSSTFGKLPFAEKANEAGIVVIHLPTGSFVGQIKYQTSVDEIYDVVVLPNKLRPNILNTITEDHKRALMIPQSTFWAIEKPKN